MDSSKSSQMRAKPNASAVYSVNPFDDRPARDQRNRSPPVPAAIGNAVGLSSTSGSRAFTRQYHALPPEYQHGRSGIFTERYGESKVSTTAERGRSAQIESNNGSRALSVPRGVNTTRSHNLRVNHNKQLLAQRADDAANVEDADPRFQTSPKNTAKTPPYKSPYARTYTVSTNAATKTPSRPGQFDWSDRDVFDAPKSTHIKTTPPLNRHLSVAKSDKAKDTGRSANVQVKSGHASIANNESKSSKGKVTSSQVATPNDPNVNLRLNLTLACQGSVLPSGNVTPKNNLPRRDFAVCDAETYKKYKIPDPSLSPEERARAYNKSSPSPPSNCGIAPVEEKLSVMVAVRIRPFSETELQDNHNSRVVYVDKSSNTVHVHGCPAQFKFNAVLDSVNLNDPDDCQKSVYDTVGQPLRRHAIDGYNACLFAYGQTGSGKTFSIAGERGNPGIIPRLVDDLFKHMAGDTRVAMTYIEIYNDVINNLLDDSTSKMQHINYKIREHSVEGPYIPNLIPVVVENPHDLISRWEIGSVRRQTAATLYNDRSSRSHAILQIIIQQKYDDLNENSSDTASQVSCGERLVSKINLVDLAGSERASTLSDNSRFKEGAYINKSLLTLGKVINQLSSDQSGDHKKHIPYRESPLTFLLKESLGGNSRTCMLATISPAKSNVEETLSTLRYASKAQLIVNRVRINEDPKIVRIRLLQQEIECLLTVLAENNIDPRPRLLNVRRAGKANDPPGKVKSTPTGRPRSQAFSISSPPQQTSKGRIDEEVGSDCGDELPAENKKSKPQQHGNKQEGKDNSQQNAKKPSTKDQSHAIETSDNWGEVGDEWGSPPKSKVKEVSNKQAAKGEKNDTSNKPSQKNQDSSKSKGNQSSQKEKEKANQNRKPSQHEPEEQEAWSGPQKDQSARHATWSSPSKSGPPSDEAWGSPKGKTAGKPGSVSSKKDGWGSESPHKESLQPKAESGSWSDELSEPPAENKKPTKPPRGNKQEGKNNPEQTAKKSPEKQDSPQKPSADVWASSVESSCDDPWGRPRASSSKSHKGKVGENVDSGGISWGDSPVPPAEDKKQSKPQQNKKQKGKDNSEQNANNDTNDWGASDGGRGDSAPKNDKSRNTSVKEVVSPTKQAPKDKKDINNKTQQKTQDTSKSKGNQKQKQSSQKGKESERSPSKSSVLEYIGARTKSCYDSDKEGDNITRASFLLGSPTGDITKRFKSTLLCDITELFKQQGKSVQDTEEDVPINSTEPGQW